MIKFVSDVKALILCVIFVLGSINVLAGSFDGPPLIDLGRNIKKLPPGSTIIQEIQSVEEEGLVNITFPAETYLTLANDSKVVAVYSYVGPIKNHKADGLGKIVFREEWGTGPGPDYVGEFKDGKIDGLGELHWGGPTARGIFKAGMAPEGEAAFYSEDGRLLAIMTLKNGHLADGPFAAFYYERRSKQLTKELFGRIENGNVVGKWKDLVWGYENEFGKAMISDDTLVFQFKNNSSFICKVNDPHYLPGDSEEEKREMLSSFAIDLSVNDPTYGNAPIPYCHDDFEYISAEGWHYFGPTKDGAPLSATRCTNPAGQVGVLSHTAESAVCTVTTMVERSWYRDLKKAAHAIRDFPQKVVNEFSRDMDKVAKDFCGAIGKTPGKNCHFNGQYSYTIGDIPVLESGVSANKSYDWVKQDIQMKREKISADMATGTLEKSDDKLLGLAALILSDEFEFAKNEDEMGFFYSRISNLSDMLKLDWDSQIARNRVAAFNATIARDIYERGERARGLYKRAEYFSQLNSELFNFNTLEDAKLFILKNQDGVQMASPLGIALNSADRKISNLGIEFARTTMAGYALDMWVLPYKLMLKNGDFPSSDDFQKTPFKKLLSIGGINTDEKIKAFYKKYPNIKDSEGFYRNLVQEVMEPVVKEVAKKSPNTGSR